MQFHYLFSIFFYIRFFGINMYGNAFCHRARLFIVFFSLSHFPYTYTSNIYADYALPTSARSELKCGSKRALTK